jgi:thiol-disulfide isomerase/thioredoxin
MRKVWVTTHLAAVFAIAGLSNSYAGTAGADEVDGRWSAKLITQNGTEIPFRLDISGSGAALKGTLYDGFEPYETTTSARFQDGKLVLNIQHYLTTITADVSDNQLKGTVVTQNRGASAQYGFAAARYVKPPATASDVPSIAGSWEIPLNTPSSKGEKAFRFLVKQNGAEVAASILRVDGDTGAYSGTYHDGKWVLSHFDGSRPGVIVVAPRPDGTLQILQNPEHPEQVANNGGAAAHAAGAGDAVGGGRAVDRVGGSVGGSVGGDGGAGGAAAAGGALLATVAANGAKPYDDSIADGRYASSLVAYRSEVARAKGLPEPENYETHTTVRDPHEQFTFNFPDVDGHLVSNDDPRFKGKVVLAIVTGTWCPNCHDEAQYLVQLDKKYRDKGLAIVALDFEEPEQQGSLERERAFVKQYGVKYTYLIAGAPAEMWEKVPQAVNLNTWPATIFIGRDGRVRGIHSGFASPASGEFHRQLEKEFTGKIEQLLAEKARTDTARTAATSTRRGAGRG